MDTFRSAPLDVELVANTKHSRSEPQSDLFFQAMFFQSRTIHTLTMIHNDIYVCVCGKLKSYGMVQVCMLQLMVQVCILQLVVQLWTGQDVTDM